MIPAHNRAEQRLSSSQEDYLEAIFLIQRSHKVARIKDIADKMEVS